ncbi:MAG: flippase-like domain-containing protein [Prevotellaceae bacterium]|jgi:uncharacterized protein (TIRG00374 family)|nr:flippase-like domain-containing protein [Prevotellaceae bacterium]
MSKHSNKAFGIKTSQILIPVAIGFIVVGWMFWKEFDVESFADVSFTWRSAGFILLACFLVLFRDFWMVVRFRMMTNYELSWGQGFRINTLKEFASSIMPPTVGNGGLIILFLNREGFNAGKSTTIAMINLLLDNFFLIFSCIIVFLFFPFSEIFNNTNVLSSSIRVTFWVVFSILCTWNIALYTGLFHRPDLIARLFRHIFRLPFLRRWKTQIVTFTDNIVEASSEIRKKSLGFWVKVFIVTIIGWTARFLIVNALFMAFSTAGNQLVIFVRQVIIFILMVISPTPGGSGLNEIAFKELYSDVALGIGPVLVIICIWRIITCYAYLLAGVIILPKWVKRSFASKKQ